MTAPLFIEDEYTYAFNRMRLSLQNDPRARGDAIINFWRETKKDLEKAGDECATSSSKVDTMIFEILSARIAALHIEIAARIAKGLLDRSWASELF